MYRQPENSNRVKSMKSRFEGLNDTSSLQKTDKSKKSPVQNKIASKPVASINGKTSEKIINNNDYMKNNSNKIVNVSKVNNENLKQNRIERDATTMKPEDVTRNKSKFDVKIQKDFSDVNKKELCNVPQLNLTRQLNDPSKKGCIKRTPAFRKDKLVNSKCKTNDDLNFSNIVNMFENNDKTNCDTVNTNNDEKCLRKTCFSDSEIKSEITKITYTPKKCLTSTISLNSQPSSCQSDLSIKHKLSNSNNAIIKKSILTSSTSVELENTPKTCKKGAIEFRQKSLSPKRPTTTTTNKNNFSSVATLKIADKKELLDNHKNETKVIENKESVPIPAYAQVIKHKQSVQENKELILTDTLKAALKQPLPTGPPPKKPPRTFAHTTQTTNSKQQSPVNSPKHDNNNATASTSKINASFCDKLNDNLSQGLKSKTPETEKKSKIKSDPKLMLQKLENALLSNKIKSPKLPRKLKSSFEATTKPSSTSSHQTTSQPNIYTNETPQKNLFPNCLPSLNCASNASITNSYAKAIPTKNNNPSMSTFFTECKGQKQEPIYAEPFQFKSNEGSPDVPRKNSNNLITCKTDTLSKSLHYMSNPVCEWNSVSSQSEYRVTVDNTKGNGTTINKSDKSVSLCENGPLTRHKLNLIMNHTYAAPSPTDSDIDSLPSTPSSSSGDTPNTNHSTIKDIILSFEQKHPLDPKTLHIPSTVKQRLTVSSLWSGIGNGTQQQSQENEESLNTDDELKNKVKNIGETVDDKKKFKAQLNRTLTEKRKNYVKRVCSTLRRKSDIKTEVGKLFECCLLVGLNVATLVPYIKNKFPTDYEVPSWVEHLCFPDAGEWSSKVLRTTPNIKSQDCQCYSLVITDEKGDRKFGYCRRVVPEEASVCLPLTYCIISSYRATGFYHKVLQELESRHGLPFGLQESFVKELYNCRFPQPGESVNVTCLLRSLVVSSCEEMLQNNQITNSENVEYVKRIVNMENGVYGHVNKVKNSDSDWVVLDQNISDINKNDFRSPKITYGTAQSSNESSFPKINKYSKDSKRSSSIINNSNDSLDSASVPASDIIRRITPENSLTINSRNSELQINKRLGQIFEDCNLNGSSDINNLKSINSPVNVFNNTSDNSQFPLLNLPNSQLIHDCLLGDVVLKRPFDTRLEDIDLTILFNTLKLTTLLQTFGSLLHERKVIFVSSSLSKLSSCVEALESILYPFNWQHTFIPVLSNNMLDIVSAPLPLIAGVLASHIIEPLIIEQGIAVNLDTSTVVCYIGDENDIIPKRLQKGLTVALQLVTDATQSDDRSRNVLVSEAFIRMFLEACGCYKQFINVNKSGQKVFERELFIKHHDAKCVNLFLEWFTETAMFNTFIQSRLDGEPTESMFEQRCIELNREKNSAALLKNSKVTQKMKNLSQRLFH